MNESRSGLDRIGLAVHGSKKSQGGHVRKIRIEGSEEEISHEDLLAGIVRRTAVEIAVVDGERPLHVMCDVCRRPVRVRPTGAIPTAHKKCRDLKYRLDHLDEKRAKDAAYAAAHSAEKTAYDQEYRRANAARLRERALEYAANNRGLKREKDRTGYFNDPSLRKKKLESAKKYAETNRERVRAYKREWERKRRLAKRNVEETSK